MNKMMEEALLKESQTLQLLDSEIKNSHSYVEQKLRPQLRHQSRLSMRNAFAFKLIKDVNEKDLQL